MKPHMMKNAMPQSPSQSPSQATSQTTPPPELPGVPLVESPFFEAAIEQHDFSNFERQIACDLHDKGYAIFDFPDPSFDQRAEALINALTKKFDIEGWKKTGWKTKEGLRFQDGWDRHENIRSIAANPEVLRLLSRIYGREAFAFQTLNFPVGTQQNPHSDAVHFSTMPERFMVGVWVAMEDIGPDQGPLVYYPGSHKWPVLYNQMIDPAYRPDPEASETERYRHYINFWRAMVETHGIEPEYFHAKKGQALIWSSNILHGGSPHKDPEKTRWSQVTHYYFKGCVYYVPRMSDPAVGRLHLKTPLDIATGKRVENIFIDTPLKDIQAISRHASKL